MNLKKKYGKVAVIMGGSSAEREISLISGSSVLKSLQGNGVDAYSFDPSIRSLAELQQANFDRAVIMLHGRGGEDGVIQGVLEYLKIPYTGSGVMASAIAMDKYRTKLIWQNVGIPVAKGQYLTKNNFNAANFQLQLSLPVVVKPACEGSTVGLSKVYKQQDLIPAINFAFTTDNAVLIEELITGSEFTITVCDGKLYPVVKIEAPEGNYDYQNKYFTNDTKYICPYDLGELRAKIDEYALLGYEILNARGITRLDFMLDQKNNIYFLEINTIPGMTPHSSVPRSYRAAGIDFDALCLTILDGATFGG